MTPTARSLAALRAFGCRVAVVEKWNPVIKRRVDLFGIIDILAVHPSERRTLAIQATSGSNVASRVAKVRAACWPPHSTARILPLLVQAGWVVEVWGWRKRHRAGTRARYVLRRVRVVDGA